MHVPAVKGELCLRLESLVTRTTLRIRGGNDIEGERRNGGGGTMCTDSKSGYSLIRKVVTAALNSQDLTNEVKQEYETVINIMSATDSEFINSKASIFHPIRGGRFGLTALHLLGDPGVNENRALELVQRCQC